MGRVLGVFDDATGQPLAGAVVMDLASGSSTTTSATGTITLAWLPAGTSLLQVRKLGYQSRLVTVSTSATDTVSVTVVLVPIAPTLPTVVTKGRSAGDTVRVLDRSGFYERRRSSGAPQLAFVTAAHLEKWGIQYLADVAGRTGRSLCRSGDTYVNGSLLTTGVWLEPGDSPLKLQLQVGDIAGIEIYTHTAEVPAQYNSTRRAGSPCVTVIWLK